jgi:LAO/AO transport system kinase
LKLTPALPDGRELGRRLRERDLTAAAAALNLIESRSPNARGPTQELLAQVSPAALGAEAPGHVIGVTGPPGVGKSSLLSRLVAEWRRRSRSVAVLAVDPSSRRSGGSLLGDRVRIEADPRDKSVFVRSSAAGNRLGGLAPATRAAAAALAAAFDVVVIETVGVGQSETEVADVADTVVVVLQPASGDVLQFLKAGIMEIPDVLVLTKADLETPARRALADLSAALLALGASDTAVCAVSAVAPPSGIDGLADALDAHRAAVDLSARRLHARRRHALDDFAAEHGERGLRALGGRREAQRWLERQGPELDVPALERGLEAQAEKRQAEKSQAEESQAEERQ